jgi:hypothetical protein
MLVDTSVWIDHLRRGDQLLARRLQDGVVQCHPFVIGELACGSMRRRQEVLVHLATLPEVSLASHAEAIAFLDGQRLWGRGIGWIDVHLLASAVLSQVTLWTRERPLAAVVRALGLEPDPET